MMTKLLPPGSLWTNQMCEVTKTLDTGRHNPIESGMPYRFRVLDFQDLQVFAWGYGGPKSIIVSMSDMQGALVSTCRIV